MAAGGKGYFATGYFALGYWDVDYWFGAAAAPTASMPPVRMGLPAALLTR